MRLSVAISGVATTASALRPHASYTTHNAPSCTSFAPSALLSTYNATFLNTTHYPAGGLNVSGTLTKVSFCELYASINYGSNDSLAFALWLPDTQYTSRFMAVGNGGMAGVIDYRNMAIQLNSGLGFAVAGGNAGHLASENNAGGGAPGVYLPYLHDDDQVSTWIHNAVSLFTPAAKALVVEYYGQMVKHAYYDGCSTGGAQGFALAEFHPEMFDGIVAGCPGNWYSHLALSFLWNAQHTDVSTGLNLLCRADLRESDQRNVSFSARPRLSYSRSTAKM
jgi:feruloyl esterase